MRVSRTDWTAARQRHPLIAAPDFRNLFLGDVLITIAERYFVLACTWWLLKSADSARLSTLLTLESMPVLVVGIAIGPLVDRWNKKTCMLAAGLLQCAITSSVAILIAQDALTFPRLCMAGALLGALIPVFEGAVNAALPQAVDEDSLLAAAAVQSSTLEYSNIVAAALAASLLAAFDFEVVMGVNAGLYLLGALFIARLRVSAFNVRPSLVQARASYLDDLRAGLRFVAGERALLAFVLVYVAKLLLLVPLLVLIPMLVREVLGGEVAWVAALETVFSIGAILTALLLSLQSSGRELARGYGGALALLALLMLALGTLHNGYAMLPAVALMGACVAVLLALSNMLFHQSVPDAMKGRFFGILETLAAAATPLGYIALGFGMGWLDMQGLLIANALGLLALAGVVLFIPRSAAA